MNNKIRQLVSLLDKANEQVTPLRLSVEKAHNFGVNEDAGFTYQNEVLPQMESLRKIIDEMEINTAKKYWPFPSYGDILFSVY